MLCRKGSVKNGRGTVPVYLNVYDLTPINEYAYWLGLGVYHSGVQVHGVEYAFGAHEYPTTGIFEGEPKLCEGFTFRKSIMIGWTELTSAQVRTVMEEMAVKYRGDAYNLITNNCNHFCNDASVRLTGIPIPSWINRLARIGLLCRCMIPVSLNTTKVRHQPTEEKGCEGERMKLRSRSKRRNPSSSSSSSTASPPGRSRAGGYPSHPPPSPVDMRSSATNS